MYIRVYALATDSNKNIESVIFFVLTNLAGLGISQNLKGNELNWANCECESKYLVFSLWTLGLHKVKNMLYIGVTSY